MTHTEGGGTAIDGFLYDDDLRADFSKTLSGRVGHLKLVCDAGHKG